MFNQYVDGLFGPFQKKRMTKNADTERFFFYTQLTVRQTATNCQPTENVSDVHTKVPTLLLQSDLKAAAPLGDLSCSSPCGISLRFPINIVLFIYLFF